MSLSEKKVLFIIPNKNFRDKELIEPRRILENNKVKTNIASKTNEICIGMLGTKITPNLTLDKVIINEYEAIIFIGGSGSTIYWNDKTALNLAKEAYLKGKLLCSICLASGTIANTGLLKGKNATGWIDTKELIEKTGGKYTGKDLEISGRIITAIGHQVSKQFGEAILKFLENKIDN